MKRFYHEKCKIPIQISLLLLLLHFMIYISLTKIQNNLQDASPTAQ